jgi:hypothetical protein
VNDIQGGCDSEENVVKFKNESTEIMKEVAFQLHKWHSNCLAVETMTSINENLVQKPINQQDEHSGIPLG